ncbi:hypothetical protein DFH29DRAFT_884254 [Suillus ampliporus]|nr:hypothetical protein DFH29DRAFT_884254 [Suillus ampliporus]
MSLHPPVGLQNDCHKWDFMTQMMNQRLGSWTLTWLFEYKCTKHLLGLSIACQTADHDEDWDWYYINMVPFRREKEYCGSEDNESYEEHDNMEEHEDLEEDRYGDEEGDDDGLEETGDNEADSTDDDDDDDDGNKVPVSALFEVMADDTVADEMDEYGYSGLDQVLDEDGTGEETDNADDFGPEDGEDVMNEFEYSSFADL